METTYSGQQFGGMKTTVVREFATTIDRMTELMSICHFDPRWSTWAVVVNIFDAHYQSTKDALIHGEGALKQEIQTSADASLYTSEGVINYHRTLNDTLIKSIEQFKSVSLRDQNLFSPYNYGQNFRQQNKTPLRPDTYLLNKIGMLLMVEDRYELVPDGSEADLGELTDDEAELSTALYKFDAICVSLDDIIRRIETVVQTRFPAPFPTSEEAQPATANSKIATAQASVIFTDKLQKGITETNLNDLTAREKVLTYCYEEGPVISRGEPGYDDYRKFQTARKRIAYPNESIHKAKPLIQSIEKIIPFLSDKAAQQANNELDTLISQFELQKLYPGRNPGAGIATK